MNDLSVIDSLNIQGVLDSLLAPIHPDSRAGADLTYSPLFDEIREARRAEDAGLAQGQWETEIKIADWALVRSLCERALISSSKDLQLAAWYIEAAVHMDGFQGLTLGLELFHGLILNFWDSCHPLPEGQDLDERAGKVEWLNTQIPFAIKKIPMTHPRHGGYTWQQWQESRWVENLGLKDSQARANAIADGKLSGEVFDKSARESGHHFYAELVQSTRQSREVLANLIAAVDNHFGESSPSLLDLRTALDDSVQLASRLYADASGHAPRNTQSSSTMAGEIYDAAPKTSAIKTAGVLGTRTDAIQALRDAARYFRQNEPQSPVSLLAERAARWAEMSMDEWLSAVIKDEGTLGQLRELLDIRTDNQ